MEEKKKFLMIDGSGLLFRAFYAIRNLTTKDGIYTNGVYGFLNMYLKAVDMLSPDYVVVAFDKSTPTFRKKDYEAYKANRQETPSELSSQFGIVKDVLDAMGVCHIDMDGYEADDLIGTLARHAEGRGLQSYLLTGDRDYFQLVDSLTDVLFTKKGISELEIVNCEWIREKYGLQPQQLIEVKGLQGDPSDNIPGVPGVGEKTALKLILEYTSIDGVYENIDSIAGKKLRQNLEENRNLAYLSRKLGTIFREVPMETDPLHYTTKPMDREKLMDRLTRLEFKTLASRFAVDAPEIVQSYEFELVHDKDWKSVASSLQENKICAFAILGNEESYQHAYPVFACFFDDYSGTKILDISENETEFCELFAPIFQNETRHWIGYDIKEAMVLLGKTGILLEGAYDDMMLMEYLIDPNRSSYSIASLAEAAGLAAIQDPVDLLGKGKSRMEFTELSQDALGNFVSGMLTTLWKAKEIVSQQLKDMGMYELYETIENPLAGVLARMEKNGVAVDTHVLDELKVEFSAVLQKYEAEVLELAGESFNINSPKQMGEVLFEHMKLPHGKKTKTGYSTNVDVLEKLVKVHPIARAILNYRKLSKLMSTYIDGFYPYIDPDQRVRSCFRQNVAATGRLSSTEPNLQNIPIRTEEGRKLRSVFVAEEGNLLIDADYSQIELRILASLSGDQTMLEAFRQGEDIHRKTAAEVNHIPLEEVTALQRSHAKAVNFGIIYGISDYGLSQDLGISRAEAKAYIEGYKDTYPSIREYMTRIVEQAHEQGYVETAFGRRRNIPELKSRNYSIRSFGERVALNTPIQGTAADVIKMAMLQVDQALRERHSRARLVLQVHDELILEAPEDEAEEIGELVVQIMQSIGNFAVPLIADMKIGKSWFETK